MAKSNHKKTALYCRLSQDDGNQGDSNSIQNQKAILMQYAKDHGFQNPEFYVDDGYSGANFNRPDFQRMITDMENGEISTIITKDLSRLGRNQLHTGLYIEERFPQFGVRYIAINDDVDTDSTESNDLMPFKNLFNEWYVRDTSRKIRAVFKAKAQRGERLGTRAPYGYCKDPMHKGKLIVDEEAAEVVRKIFSLCAGGLGPTNIGNRLREEKILTPAVYAYKKYGLVCHGINLEEPYNWATDSIAKMLENEAYIRNTVNMRYSSKSYKDKKRGERPREEWMITPNTHEAIIDKETWEIVQKVRSNRRRMPRYGDKSIFAGLLYCADCGEVLDYTRSKEINPPQSRFRCRGYKKHGMAACTAHNIRECVLEDVVLEDLRRITAMARNHTNEFAAYIGKKQTSEQQREIRTLEREILTLQKRKNELNTIFRRLYEDSVLERITMEQFQMLSSGYVEEQHTVENQIAEKTELLKRIKDIVSDISHFVAKAKRYTDIQELSTELLHLFIEKIVIHEKPQKYSRSQTIEIYYKDIGCLTTEVPDEKAV